MSASHEDYVEKITEHLDTAADSLGRALAHVRGLSNSQNVDTWNAKSRASEAYSSIAQGHNDVAMTYVRLLEITTKAGAT